MNIGDKLLNRKLTEAFDEQELHAVPMPPSHIHDRLTDTALAPQDRGRLLENVILLSGHPPWDIDLTHDLPDNTFIIPQKG
tara:strand:+ start:9633 stop:9875 length:243 start_codon:yes stop_codon:yes gene_type:complete